MSEMSNSHHYKVSFLILVYVKVSYTLPRESTKRQSEACRTMKAERRRLVSMYYENILLRSFMFPVTKFILWAMRVKFLGGAPINLKMTKDEFGRYTIARTMYWGKYIKKRKSQIL